MTYNSIIDCCIRCRRFEVAQGIFEEMKQVGSEVSPDLITYSTMVKGHCQEQDLKGALTVLQDMEKRNIKPDEVLYNSLLDGCCKADQIDIAMMLYKNMRTLGIKPSNVTFSILIKIYGKSKEV